MSSLSVSEQLSVEERNGTAVLHLQTHYQASENLVQDFRELLLALIEKGCRRLILDFSKVVSFNGSLCGPLILAWRRMQERNGQLILARIPQMPMEYFRITKLDQVFDIRQEVLIDEPEPPSQEEQAFYRGIREAGDDPSMALIFADWLEDHLDERADFIRLQCELEQVKDNPTREAELQRKCSEMLELYEQHWVGSLAGMVTSWTWKRGLIHSVKLSANAIEEHARSLFAIAPIQELRVEPGLYFPNDHRRRRWLRIFQHYSIFSELSVLRIDQRRLTDKEAEPLLHSVYLDRLKKLELRDQGNLSPATLKQFKRRFGRAFQVI